MTLLLRARCLSPATSPFCALWWLWSQVPQGVSESACAGSHFPSPCLSAVVPGEVEGITQRGLGEHEWHESRASLSFVSCS